MFFFVIFAKHLLYVYSPIIKTFKVYAIFIYILNVNTQEYRFYI